MARPERLRFAAQAEGRVVPMHTALQVDPPVDVGGHDSELMKPAFDAGMRSEQSRIASWEKSRFWRCACGFSTVAFVTLCGVVCYWVVAVSTTMSRGLDELHAQRPELMLKTVDDASAVLSGAARMSAAMGDMSERAAPSLLNMTTSSASLLERVALLMGKPTITVAVGGAG